MPAISTRTPEVTVEYTSRNRRVTKHFTNAHSAKRFYVSKDRGGHFPKIVGTNPERNRTMTTETTTTSAPKSAKKKTAKKATASKSKSTKKATPKKKAATKKSANEASKEKTSATSDKSPRRRSNLPAEERRSRFLKALKALGAVSQTTAVPAPRIVKKDGKINDFDVYCLGYHKNRLQRDGLVGTVVIEGERTLCYFITKKGISSIKK